MAVDEESLAATVRSDTGDPDGSDWSPGPARVIVFVIDQVSAAEPDAPDPSVAVSVTGWPNTDGFAEEASVVVVDDTLTV